MGGKETATNSKHSKQVVTQVVWKQEHVQQGKGIRNVAQEQSCNFKRDHQAGLIEKETLDQTVEGDARGKKADLGCVCVGEGWGWGGNR